MRQQRFREAFWGWLFILPTVLVLGSFTVFPALIAGYYSFTRFDFLSPPRFTGWSNYARALSDPVLGQVTSNTLLMCLGVPIGMAVALALATLLTDRQLRFAPLYRALFFLPVILPLVALGTVWVRLLNTESGLVNAGLGVLGVAAVPWLTSYGWSKVAVTLVGIWSGFGGSLVVLMGGLSTIPLSYYEAARLDGAGSWTVFSRITLPLLTPSLTLVSITSFIGALQIFDLVLVLTNGGPGLSSTSIAQFIYGQAFKSFDMGYAATLSVLLFVLMFALSAGQFWLSERLRVDA